jgi:hypothetical protein
VTGAGAASYLYDGFQRLRYRAQGGAITNHVWDAFGHIIAELSGSDLSILHRQSRKDHA